jgi:hypothetical protein
MSNELAVLIVAGPINWVLSILLVLQALQGAIGASNQQQAIPAFLPPDARTAQLVAYRQR